VAITGMRRDAGIAQGRAAGFPANLGKPVPVQRLDAEVPELLPERGKTARTDRRPWSRHSRESGNPG
jgi:hypothetical protein